MQSIFQAQRDAFNQSLPVRYETRVDRLDRAIALLKTHNDRLCAAMDADFGQRPKVMSEFVDVVSSINALKHARSQLRHWMKREKRPVRFPLNLLGARAWIEYQPKGVIGILSPWNFPVNLTFSPLADALAAGNRVMIKPSEASPQTSALMAELIAETFDPSEVAVITGGPEVAAEFSALPFDHLLFTGSTRIGHHVMQAAAKNLTPVTLELGGKSPVIVGRGTDLAKAADKIILGKMMNAGQVCLAPDYLLVPDDQVDAMAEHLIRSCQSMYPADQQHQDESGLISHDHQKRLEGLLEQATSAGVQTRQAGLSTEQIDRHLPLTLLIRPTDDLAVMSEEIFGPLLPILGYSTVDQAIDYINGRDRPLGLYYFGKDRSEQRAVLERTISGGVTLDDVIFHVSAEELPFGGIGASGIGAYHGYDGFRSLSHAKAVYRQSRLNLAALIGFRPPYGKRLRKMLDWELRS